MLRKQGIDKFLGWREAMAAWRIVSDGGGTHESTMSGHKRETKRENNKTWDKPKPEKQNRKKTQKKNPHKNTQKNKKTKTKIKQEDNIKPIKTQKIDGQRRAEGGGGSYLSIAARGSGPKKRARLR